LGLGQFSDSMGAILSYYKYVLSVEGSELFPFKNMLLYRELEEGLHFGDIYYFFINEEMAFFEFINLTSLTSILYISLSYLSLLLYCCYFCHCFLNPN